ncbi:MAG: UDP-N-acetylmuramoyl-L-alanine--D-glutamate ligase [Clostridiales bacterium]|nr:UDP-N-acetylmuramoyl-L-alanine--D-glutamate ligase [Clostridiales bacterium]
MELHGKKILVAGSGISGIGAVKLLSKLGADIILYDENEKLKKKEIQNKLPQNIHVEIMIGKLTKEIIEHVELMIISPGIPLDSPFVNDIREQGILIWGEIELAYECSKGKLIGITGTNGKTTTTSLTGNMIKAFYESVFVVGNIGTPYTNVALETNAESITVAEISSFQLETIEKLRPNVSAILNITPDHLNRHKTMENYNSIKMSITKEQGPKDVCVLNYDDKVLRNFGQTLHTNVVYFSIKEKLNKGLYLEDGNIIYETDSEKILICPCKNLKILGTHNIENVMAATAMSYSMGVPLEIIREEIEKFQGVEHRIEYVREKDRVFYYNDSKGTNTDASIKAIEAMVRPTILIAGGYDKESIFDEYVKAFKDKVRYLVLLGETKDKIAQTATNLGFTSIIFTKNLKEAVEVSRSLANPEDAVLLSPACASWDMFKSYEERGNLFKQYVNEL